MTRFPTISKRKWTRFTAAHLAARAGFIPSPEEVDDLTGLSPEIAVAKILQSPETFVRAETPDWFDDPLAKSRFPGARTWKEMKDIPEEERRKINQDFRKQNRKWLEQTRSWWIRRMITEPNPFDEKLALFWHGHFATAYQKVSHPFPMLQQNLMFREKGRGSLTDLLEAVSADPAMLHYLDNFRSNRRKPNENYARELLELFSLGEGHYSEEDVRSAARAFTGWTLSHTTWEFRFNEKQHDSGDKTFMGETGSFSGQDILARITALPRSAEYLSERLWTFYASDIPNRQAIRDIASVLRSENSRIEPALRALFLHEDFYHPSVVRGKIKSPVELCVGLLRSLRSPLNQDKRIHKACEQLGQSLFDPPSVKGWDGGAAWITASGLAMRYSFADRFLKQKDSFSLPVLFPNPDISRDQARDRLLNLLHASTLRQQDRDQLDLILANLPPPSDWTRRDAITALSHLVQQPQYQLC